MKLLLKGIELILWLPFLLAGFVFEFIYKPFQAGREAVDVLHNWMDKKI